jgi:nucleoside-diphosphate-sugar epimerase
MSETRDTVIITGGSGFIGEALVAGLAAASYRVVGLDRIPPKQLKLQARTAQLLSMGCVISDATQADGHHRRKGSVEVL